MNGEIPAFSLVYFTIKTKADGVIDVDGHQDDCPGVACPDGSTVRILGENVAAKKAGDSPLFWSGKSDTDAVRRLVEIEIGDSPSDVGGPIDIIVVNRGGAGWLEPKQNCR